MVQAAEGRQKRSRWRRVLPAPLIVVAVVAVFGQVAGFEFVSWDDAENVTANPYLNPVSWQGVAYLWQHPYFSIYVPVTYSVWGFVAWLSGLLGQGAGPAPMLFHLCNVLVHLVNGLLVYRLLRMLVGPAPAAGAGALLFVLHPLQVENVAWVSGLMHLLAGCLSLTALWLYLQHARGARDGEPLGRRRVMYWAATGCFVLALLSKSSAAALPMVAWVIDVLLVRRDWRACTRALAPWLLPAAGAAILLRYIDPDTVQRAMTALWLRPLVAGDALAFYLGKLVLPVRLAIDYARTPEVARQLTWFYLAWLVPLALGWLLWRVRGRWPWLTAAGGVFLAASLPMLGLVPMPFQAYSTVADRYVYLAMLGPALALAGLLRTRRSRPVLLAVGAALLLMALQSSLQTMYWRNSLALFRHALEVTPDSWVAHGNLGLVTARAGDIPLGLAYIQRAIALRPDAYNPRFNYATALRMAGRDQEAVVQLRELVRYHPEVPEAHDFLACVLDQTGQTAEALTHWRRAIELDPYFAQAWHNLGVSHDAGGRAAEAVTAWRAALCADPDYRPSVLAMQRVLREHPELRTETDPPLD